MIVDVDVVVIVAEQGFIVAVLDPQTNNNKQQNQIKISLNQYQEQSHHQQL